MALSLLAVGRGLLAALEPAAAKGQVVWEETVYPLAHALAVERQNEYTHETEIAVILSDLPVSIEDVEDDWIEHQAAHLTITLDPEGKATYAQINYGFSMAGAPDGVRFDGTLDRAARRVVGTVTSGGVVDVMGSPLEYEVEIDAPFYVLAPPPAPTPADRAAAERSPYFACFKSLQQALAEESPQGIVDTVSAAYLEREGGAESARYSLGFGMPAETPTARRVIEAGDRARLYLETGDQTGIVRLVKEQGAWRIDRQKWSYK